MNILLTYVSKWEAIEVALMSFLGEHWPAGWRLAWPGDDVGHLYKGCAHKTPWEEGFLLLLYHMAQSSRLAWYITAGRGKRSLFPSCPHLSAQKRSKLAMTFPAGRVLQLGFASLTTFNRTSARSKGYKTCQPAWAYVHFLQKGVHALYKQ